MACNCTKGIAENIKEELWSYFALSGLLFLNIGIVLMVYALKRATPQPTIMEILGIGLIVMGVIATLASWYVHRQHRRKKPICAWPFCRCPIKNTHTDTAQISSGSRHMNGRAGGARFFRPQKLEPTSDNSFKTFCTIEFQTYEEFTKRDNADVQGDNTQNYTRKVKVEPQRQKIQVHPQSSADEKKAAMFVNAIYAQKDRDTPMPVTRSSPVILKVS